MLKNSLYKYMDLKERFSLVKRSRTLKFILNEFDLKNKKVLDLGCSSGEYLVNFGAESLGVTINDEEVLFGKKNSLNIVRGNVEFLEEIGIKKGDFEVVWANNLIEHLLSPHSFLVKLKDLVDDRNLLILGVPVIPSLLILLNFSKFRGSLADSHINFFTSKTLKLTVERAGWKIKEIRSFWFKNKIMDSIISFLSPHIFIIAEKDKNFKYSEKKNKEWKSDLYYNNLLDRNK